MTTSVFDLFTIGIGPSSSHTVGPMKAAAMFARELAAATSEPITRIRIELFGSLGATGRGHGSEPAVLLGLEGADPATVETDRIQPRASEIIESGSLRLLGDPGREVPFHREHDLILHRNTRLEFHSNALTFTGWAGEQVAAERTFYSVGGGFVVAADDDGHAEMTPERIEVPYPFRSGADLLEVCESNDMRICEVMFANECARRPATEVRARLLEIWRTMQACVDAGVATVGTLPGGLKVRRRAAALYDRLVRDAEAEAARAEAAGLARSEGMPADRHVDDPLIAMDWVQLWALAVNEENAAGGRVVTAPTNGAAGIIPAVLQYAVRFVPNGSSEDAICNFLLTAGAIAAVYHQTASISGAEVGCQGEVGTACSMAAAALTEAMGGSARQACCAAEIGMEHHLGLTCDPVGGLVQIPCIERNAIGATKAIASARLALHGDGDQIVSLDQVIRTMMQTGADMKAKYKETALGGLAVNIVEC